MPMTAIKLKALPGTARYELLKVLDGCTSEFSTSASETRLMKEKDRRLVLALEAEALADAAERVRGLGMLVQDTEGVYAAGFEWCRSRVLAILEEPSDDSRYNVTCPRCGAVYDRSDDSRHDCKEPSDG